MVGASKSERSTKTQCSDSEKDKRNDTTTKTLRTSTSQSRRVTAAESGPPSHNDINKIDEKELQKLPYYHGYLPREDLAELLKTTGEFLLRMSEVEADSTGTTMIRSIILSVAYPHQQPGTKESEPAKEPEVIEIKNMILKKKNNKYAIHKKYSFPTIAELVNFYVSAPHCLFGKKFQLKNGIPLMKWEFTHDQVILGKTLGSGAFGEVHKALLKRDSGKNVDVAIKMTKGTVTLTKEQIKELMMEARIMRNFKHPNIVRIYGVAVDEQPLYILLEFVSGGELKSYLKKHANQISPSEKLTMSLSAAQGLLYLHKNNCIHRDVASRNCLITTEKIVKISDFGLSKIGPAYKMTTAMKLPIKWLAPETIATFVFSLKSDVYSFGVLMYEIMSEAKEPWEGLTNAETKAAVKEGKSLEFPPCCPAEMKKYLREGILCETNLRVCISSVGPWAGLPELSYKDRLIFLNQSSLAARRRNAGLSLMYKMYFNEIDIPFTNIFRLSSRSEVCRVIEAVISGDAKAMENLTMRVKKKKVTEMSSAQDKTLISEKPEKLPVAKP